MTVGRDEAIRRFMGEFQEKFQVSPYADTPLVTAAFESIRELNAAGSRVVSRHEIKEQMEDNGHQPANLQDQLEELKQFGVVFAIPRFGSSTNKWYMIDEPFIDWLGEVYDHREPPMLSEARTEGIAYHLGREFVMGSEPGPLAAWFHGKCPEDYVVADVEMVTITEMAKLDQGLPDSRPDGYLLEAYVQDGGWADSFDEHIVHAELTGTFAPEDQRILEENVEEGLGTLLAAMRYDEGTTFDVGAVRRNYLSQDTEKGDADETTPEAWQKKSSPGSKLEKVTSDVSSELIRASTYYGRWSG